MNKCIFKYILKKIWGELYPVVAITSFMLALIGIGWLVWKILEYFGLLLVVLVVSLLAGLIIMSIEFVKWLIDKYQEARIDCNNP